MEFLLIEFVPFGDLSSRRTNHLVPMVQSGAGTLGTAQVQSPNNLKNHEELNDF